ncbi:MCE family protein [bacterium]|jgi:phospholipid/cholesterol/gamma-HCH transport system substrate-binding protein|nr:MCE family protein [bacterium]
MKAFKTEFLIATSVIVSSLVLLAALSVAISGVHLSSPKNVLTVDLPSAVGLTQEAAVRYAGTPVGKIHSMRPLNDEERAKTSPGCAIRLVLDIHHQLPALRVGTTASITADTVLGEKYLNLDPGPVANPSLPADAILYAKRAASLDEVMTSGKELLDGVNELLNKNDSAITQAILDLKNVLQNFKVIATYGKTFMGTVARKPWRLLWGGPVPRLPSEDTILKSDKPVPAPIPND